METFDRQFVYMAMMEETVYQVKIGHTKNPMSREQTLFSSGVPAPYHMLHVWEVENMVWVEQQVIHPALARFRNIYWKEIFHLDEMYPDTIDHTIWDSVNGLHLANRLADDIDALLTQRGIEFRRWWYYNLQNYDAGLQEYKAASR